MPPWTCPAGPSYAAEDELSPHSPVGLVVYHQRWCHGVAQSNDNISPGHVYPVRGLLNSKRLVDQRSAQFGCYTIDLGGCFRHCRRSGFGADRDVSTSVVSRPSQRVTVIAVTGQSVMLRLRSGLGGFVPAEAPPVGSPGFNAGFISWCVAEKMAR